MNPESSPGQSVFDQILAGDNREVQMLVAQGLFPLPPQELVPMQLALTRQDDQELATTARSSLQSLDPKIAADVVATTDDIQLLDFFGSSLEHPVVLEAILRNRHVSAEVLASMAPKLSSQLQEILLLRQDIIVEEPSILDRMEENPELSNFSQRRIDEFREHLVRSEPIAEPVAEDEAEEAEEEVTAEEAAAAIAAARETPTAGETEEVTGLTEAQIRSLPVPIRTKLARGAPRSLRAILVKDKASMVAVAVLQGNALTESEIELYAASRSVSEEILAMIANNRQWNRKYNIVHALIRNPRTSVGLAVRMTPRLSARDLRNLSRDRNVSEAVRNTAERLYRIKSL